MFGKILVIQTAFIGDVILATSLIEKLHKFYPDSQLDILVRKGNEMLFKGHPFINKVLVFDKKNKYSSLIHLIKKIRSENYNLLVNVQRFFSSGLLAALSGAKSIYGFSSNPLSFLFTKKIIHNIDIENSTHEIERNNKLIEDITDAKPLMPKLYPPAFNTFDLNHKYVCIAPASVWFTKMLPKERWIELILLLPEDVKIYLIGAPADATLCESIRHESKHENCINLAGKLTLLESAALMKKAIMNYVNDSAPLHLCSAVNAPVTAVFCSTSPEFGFTPLSENSFVVQTKEKLACKPCGLHGKKSCPKGHFNCSKIDVNELIEKVNCD